MYLFVFQGKEGFDQEETEEAAKNQIKSQNKNKGNVLRCSVVCLD